jgi:hypothetical protein
VALPVKASTKGSGASMGSTVAKGSLSKEPSGVFPANSTYRKPPKVQRYWST